MILTAFRASAALVFVASLAGFVSALAPGGALNTPAGAWSPDGVRPLLWNLAIFSVFALHHSVLARSGVKARLVRWLPATYERSAYIWVASVLFTATYLNWQQVPGSIWRVPDAWRGVVWAIQGVGVIMTLHAARSLDVFELAGLRESRTTATIGASPDPPVERGLYRIVRHPIYLGWLLLVWPATTLTGTRAAWAAASTVYLLIAIPLEERGLVQVFGPAYAEYRRRVRWRLVPGVY